MHVVTQYGTMWARNTKNINHVPSRSAGGVGIYVLYDGSMPVYVGKGNIKWRIMDARRSKRRGPFWDRFSWYALPEAKAIHDVEVLVLRILPRYLRALTRQDGHFLDAKKVDQIDEDSEPISRKPPKRTARVKKPAS